MADNIYPGGGCVRIVFWFLGPILLFGIIAHNIGRDLTGLCSGLIVLAVAIGCVVFSVERRRRELQRRRWAHRCLHCGYSLTGNLSGYCPECGTPDLSE